MILSNISQVRLLFFIWLIKHYMEIDENPDKKKSTK